MHDRAELRTLAFALLAALLLWNVPYGNAVLYPFKLLATWFHEMSHALVMLITGAGLDRVEIYRDTSGLSYAVWSIEAAGTAAIAAAGYMGTPLWGAVMLALTPTPKSARRALIVVGALMILTAIIVVAPAPPNGDEFGPWVVAAMGATLAVAGALLPARWRVFAAHFLAAQLCINALLDIRVLLRPMQVVNGQLAGNSDASQMAASTFGVREPWAVWLWAGGWLAWSLLVLFVALRINARRAAKSAASSAPTTA